MYNNSKGLFFLNFSAQVLAILCSPAPLKNVIYVIGAIFMSEDANTIIICRPMIICALLFMFHKVETILNMHSDLNSNTDISCQHLGMSTNKTKG